MASIFDQYEASMSRSIGSKKNSSSASSLEPISSGYINTNLEDDTPIFNKSKVCIITFI